MRLNYVTADGPDNFAGYGGEPVTNLLRGARAAMDQVERARMYREAQRVLAEDCSMLFLHFEAILQVSSARPSWTRYPDAVFRLYDAKLS